MATVLILDDQPVHRDLMITLLSSRGHAVLEARDGAQALLMARAQHPDLVVTDLITPVMDGYELLRALRADPGLASTRVICYTPDYLRDAIVPMAAFLGVHHVVVKPAEPLCPLAVAERALAEAPGGPAGGWPDEGHEDYLRVITAVNGLDATEVAASHPGPIDLLVTDVIMPQLLGKEAADRIRVLYPAVTVLFMSGYTQGVLDTKGVLEADVNLIEKPFTEASLLAKLSEIMPAGRSPGRS